MQRSGYEEEVAQGVRIPVGRGFAGRVAADRKPVILDDVDHADVLNPIRARRGSVDAWRAAPRGRRETGVLHVGVLRKRLFTTGDVDKLELVASRVALAIERARLHEEVRTLDRLKANFVAIASHELRTPAASVYGVLTTLAQLDKDLSPDARAELLRTGVEQGERLRRLLEDLLDLSRLDSGVIRVNAKPVVVRTALEEIAREAIPAGTPLRLNVPRDLAAVIDRLVLDRVLSNLLTNAARYGEPPLLVVAELRDHHLRIAVCDEGRGVPEELQGRLFERFARGDDAARQRARARDRPLVRTRTRRRHRLRAPGARGSIRALPAAGLAEPPLGLPAESLRSV